MIIGSKIYNFEESENSMELAKRNSKTAPDGSIFLVKNLKAAHGRQARIWEVYPGQLSMTILLKPQILEKIDFKDLPLSLNQLNMAVSLGTLKTLYEYDVKLKWPNDFILNDKKVGGMLIELSWIGSNLQAIIVGLSINVNNIFEKFKEK